MASIEGSIWRICGLSYLSGLAARAPRCDCARWVPPPAACGTASPLPPPASCSSRTRTLPVPATAVVRPDAVATGGTRAGAWCWGGGDAARWPCWLCGTGLGLWEERGVEIPRVGTFEVLSVQCLIGLGIVQVHALPDW